MAVFQKRVIYHEFTDIYRQDIMDYLYEHHAWKPVLLFGHNAESMQNWVGNNHIDCVLQDIMELRQAQFDYSKIGTPVPIDASIISSLSKYELNFLADIPDVSGWNYSFEERKMFYYEMLKYWNTAIHYLQPDLIVFFTWPQSAACHSLYLLCKYHYNIDVLFLDAVPFFDRHYHFVGTSLQELYAPFIRIYESNEAIVPGEDVRTYLSGVRNKNAKIPEYINNFYKADQKVKWDLLKSFVYIFLHGTVFRKESLDWKKNRKPYYLAASRMNQFEYLMFLERVRRKNRQLRKIYKSFCVQPDFNSKYLYFAAPYQPEAVTVINGGVYEELFLVLDILSASVPADWVIYYKEHPATFLEGFLGSQKRSRRFYERVDSYHNIQMIPSEADTFEMIDHSQAVATAAGTAAWESVVRGKPALSFGNAWYQGCRSIFTINTLQDAQSAIEKIVNGYSPDPEDIERYAASIEKVAVKGMVHYDFYQEIKECHDPKYEMERIAKALYDAYARLYPEKAMQCI
jgi:hypothetical protein